MGFGPALFAISAAQAVSQISSGYAQNSEAKANATMVENTGRYNAAIFQGKANIIDIQSNIQQGQYTRAEGEYAAKSTAAVAKQGITPTGSAAAAMLNAQTQIGIDAAIAKFNSTNEKNYDIASASDATRTAGLQADAIRRGGQQAIKSGYSGALSSLLQGGVNYGMYKLPKTTSFDFSTKLPREGVMG